MAVWCGVVLGVIATGLELLSYVPLTVSVPVWPVLPLALAAVFLSVLGLRRRDLRIPAAVALVLGLVPFVLLLFGFGRRF